MHDIAIRVENLGKLYRIGVGPRHDTLRDALAHALPRFPRRNPQAREKIREICDNSWQRDSEEFWALRDVSFEVKCGEVVGVIGRNGAGKSTLLKILSRITEPTTGIAEIHGRVGSLLEVGTGFHPELTGRENVYLNGAILGMKRTEIALKFDEIVAFSEIEKFLDTPVKRYSSGMYVRLAFAVAAHLEPEILLVDEVLAVGDAVFQKKCLGKMGEVAGEGRTVFFVSHNMVAVQTLCGRAFWLESGRMRMQGNVSDLVTAYLRSGLPEQDSGERVWSDMDTAPGNETVRLQRISVRPEIGNPGDVITMQTALRIELEYWNLLSGVHLHPTLHIYNDQGIVAFSASAGFAPDPELHEHPPIGLLRSVCHIPGNLLNSGFYHVGLLLVRGNMGATYHLDEAVGFEIVDINDRKFSWFGREPGVVQPMLIWETSLAGSA